MCVWCASVLFVFLVFCFFFCFLFVCFSWTYFPFFAHSDLAAFFPKDIGGVSLIAVLFRTNVVALVGGGRNPIDAKQKGDF